MVAKFLKEALWTVGATAAFVFSPQVQAADPLKALSANVVRSIEFDLCLPATAQEYVALGKNAIIMLEASSAIETELPLKSVFVQVGEIRIPLQRIWRSEIAPSGDRFVQVSFYLVPIQRTKKPGRLAADFAGERSDFGISTFGPDFYDDGAPAFARLDEYDNASEPDMDAVRRVLRREYPDQYKG